MLRKATSDRSADHYQPDRLLFPCGIRRSDRETFRESSSSLARHHREFFFSPEKPENGAFPLLTRILACKDRCAINAKPILEDRPSVREIVIVVLKCRCQVIVTRLPYARCTWNRWHGQPRSAVASFSGRTSTSDTPGDGDARMRSPDDRDHISR